MRKKEGIYTKPLVDGIIAIGGYAKKIPDPVGIFKTVQRPFDVFGCYRGRMLAIECKWAKEPQAFSIKQLEEHQIKALNASEKAGALCFVVLFTKYENHIHMLVWRWKVFRRKVGPFGKAWIIDAIKRKGSTVIRRGIFPATWLREAMQ